MIDNFYNLFYIFIPILKIYESLQNIFAFFRIEYEWKETFQIVVYLIREINN